ncbi:MAG: acetyl/propionyl/methylcrotonyl-CoA carboxylase subunit alpha [Promethearchaeota archaeon]
MFSRILVANRGEIAVRAIRAMQEMGIHTVAVYSDVDRKSLHVRAADEIVPLGRPEPAESYLNMDKIIAAAKSTNAQAIYPGYGFLSENAEFARRCWKENLVFIGPKPDVIAAMGDKIAAKETASKANVPVLPGYHGSIDNMDILLEKAEEIGYPLMIKAAAGGGGKGMRIVVNKKDLLRSFESAQREAEAAFGEGSVFLEKYINNARHVEFQILADNSGHTIHLFERECSIQRRHQKIIEETPSSALNGKLREKMGEAAIRAAKSANYSNAGSVEFLLAPAGHFYFLEVNARLQVEHAITEVITGIDLLKWQIRIASGEELLLTQDQIIPRGHAIECRIYAEDPEKEFMPSPGKISYVDFPSGVNIRHDYGIEAGQEISTYYDPMIAKLIVHSETREESLKKMDWALSNYVALGVRTNVSFLRKVLRHPDFVSGNYDTDFVSKYFRNWRPNDQKIPPEAIIAASLYELLEQSSQNNGTPLNVHPRVTDPHSPWKSSGRWGRESVSKGLDSIMGIGKFAVSGIKKSGKYIGGISEKIKHKVSSDETDTDVDKEQEEESEAK